MSGKEPGQWVNLVAQCGLEHEQWHLCASQMMCEITWDLQSEGRTFRQETAEFGIRNMLGRSSLETILLTAQGGAEAG